MSSQQDSQNWNLRLPETDFFWAVVDIRDLPRASRKRRESQLKYLAEPLFPTPMNQLQIVFVEVGQHLAIACAAEQAVLESKRGQWLSIGPSAIPEHVRDELGSADLSLDPSSINMLAGPLASPILTRTRRQQRLHATSFVIIILVIFAIGVYRRDSRADRIEDKVLERIAMVHSAVLGPSTGAGPRHHEFVAESRRLNAEAMSWEAKATEPTENPDATQVLVQLLEGWPDGAHTKTNSIIISGPAVTMVNAFDDMGQVQQFLDGLHVPEMWENDQQRTFSRGDGVTLTTRYVVGTVGEEDEQ